MKILFLHGWKSIPGSIKATYLKDAGHTVINPALDDDDFEKAIRTAQAEYDERKPDVIVGSSRGGAVAMNIESDATPIVLLCPAWKKWGIVRSLKPDSIVLHSRSDDVIPFADSEELVARSGLPPETLIEIGNDHRLADEGSLAVLLWACRMVASHEHLPSLEEDAPSRAGFSRNGKATMRGEVTYVCDACGEEIVIPLDVTEGSSQEYIEDCPVCCRGNVIHVAIDEDGDARVWAEADQDYK